MKLQLFIEDQELDLTGTETFPLNKTFENLYNPTDIITEYSKSINIPITLNNNKILGNSYRLDREIVVNNTTNIGMYLDPNKRIPMKLMYNSEVVLDGYAKFVSATTSAKNNHYTLNLFGVLGDIFNKLRDVVVSIEDVDETLEDPEKYVINDYSLDNYGKEVPFDNYFVSDSWYYDEIPLSHPSETSVHFIYGAAPTYSGYYPDFDPARVQWITPEELERLGLEGTPTSLIEDELRTTWIKRYYTNKGITTPTDAQKEEAEAWVDGLDPSGFVGDGFKDYQMGDYRGYKQRPFIYFNKLMYMYKDKLEELTDYKLELDQNWFNVNNPYWAKMCYMFEFLQKGGDENYKDINLIDTTNITTTSELKEDKTASYANMVLYTTTLKTPILGSTTSTGLITNPFNLCLDLLLEKSLASIGSNGLIILMYPNTCIKIDIKCGDTTQTFFSAGATYSYIKQNLGLWPSPWANPTDDNFINWAYAPDNMIEGWRNNNQENENFTYITIPSMVFEGDFDAGDEMTITVTLANKTIKPYPSASFYHASYNPVYPGTPIYIDGIDPTTANNDTAATFRVTVTPITYRKPWHSVPVGLKSFYKKEDPLFNVILEYTKMFGLVWSVDYATQTVKLQRREELFKDYQIEDWGSKLDKTQDMVVEPVAFPTKYIRFGYEETDGYRYTSYTKSYDVEYGDKIVKTGYDFNSDDTNMLEGIVPSMSSNRNFITYNDALHWNLSSATLKAKPDYVQRLECANEEDSASIQACNWCMRGKSVGRNDAEKKCYITNDTPLMLAEEKSYYIDPRAIEAGYFGYPTVVTHYGLPVFSPVYKDENRQFATYNTHYSCLFNTPYVDYTTDKSFLSAKGRTLYDLFWNQFINERYNAQNKKVTAFFNLSISDYNQFKFNKFVSLDNQLFMVNKIMDFNPTNNKSTKCELIQISNTNNYTQPLESYPYILTNADDFEYQEQYNAYVVYSSDGYAGVNLVCRCYPDSEIEIILKGVDGSTTNDDYPNLVYPEDVKRLDDNTTSYYIYCGMADYGIHRVDFDVILTSGDYKETIPFSIQYR